MERSEGSRTIYLRVLARYQNDRSQIQSMGKKRGGGRAGGRGRRNNNSFFYRYTYRCAFASSRGPFDLCPTDITSLSRNPPPSPLEPLRTRVSARGCDSRSLARRRLDRPALASPLRRGVGEEGRVLVIETRLIAMGATYECRECGASPSRASPSRL